MIYVIKDNLKFKSYIINILYNEYKNNSLNLNKTQLFTTYNYSRGFTLTDIIMQMQN